MAKLIKGALIGSIVLFIWSYVSHAFIPWYEGAFKRFAQEEVVANVLKAHGSGTGMYVYPMGPDPGPNPTAEQKKASEEEAWARMEKGPFALVVYKEGEWEGMWPSMIGAILIDFAVVFLVMALLLAAPMLTFWGRVWFVTIAGIAGGLGVMLQYWNWWGFTTVYTLVSILDTTIGWFLVGIVIAKWGVGEKLET